MSKEKIRPPTTSNDVLELLDKDPDDLVHQLKITWKEITELKAYEKLLREVLGQKCLDQENKIIETSYGAVKYVDSRTSRRWDRERLVEFVYRRALDGKDFVDENGEMKVEAHHRVFAMLDRVFRFEPKDGAVKKLGESKEEGLQLLEEFSSLRGEVHADIKFLGEKDE